jgi:hypothetical protein
MLYQKNTINIKDLLKDIISISVNGEIIYKK